MDPAGELTSSHPFSCFHLTAWDSSRSACSSCPRRTTWRSDKQTAISYRFNCNTCTAGGQK